MHRRMRFMRYQCKRYGKADPGLSKLEELAAGLQQMKCPSCGIEMVWTCGRFDRSGIRKRVVTLQHDRDGTFKLICFSCNSRHFSFEGDSFYTAPAGMKQCAVCKQTLPLDAFPKDKSMFLGRFSNCRQCESQRYLAYYRRNAERCKERARRFYYQQKAQAQQV